MLRYFIVFLILLQIALTACGIWMVQQTNPLVAGTGWFVIMTNVIFIGINVHNFFSA